MSQRKTPKTKPTKFAENVDEVVNVAANEPDVNANEVINVTTNELDVNANEAITEPDANEPAIVDWFEHEIDA